MMKRSLFPATAIMLALGATPAASCLTGTALSQSFPSGGPAFTQWDLCWQIVRMPDQSGFLSRSETLVITEAEFRPGIPAAPVRVIGDMRMAEIFVPYHAGTPRFHDLTDFSFSLVSLTTTECPGTRIASNRLCVEVKDRGLAWRDPFASIARRGQTLVLWGIVNASNYDYLMQYEFDDDGAIVVRAAATGQKLGGPTDTRGHFHNFAWRVNLDLAGAAGDTVHVSESTAGTTTVRDKEKAVTTEGGIKLKSNAFTHLEVEDATRLNSRGRLLAYTLAPLREGVAKFGESWTKFPVWVTRNASNQLRARDVASYDNNEAVAGQDVVVWYIDHHNHENNMRDEDRDTVPLSWVGFKLEPQNLWADTPFYP
jgi:primary-amine oxidase